MTLMDFVIHCVSVERMGAYLIYGWRYMGGYGDNGSFIVYGKIHFEAQLH